MQVVGAVELLAPAQRLLQAGRVGAVRVQAAVMELPALQTQAVVEVVDGITMLLNTTEATAVQVS